MKLIPLHFLLPHTTGAHSTASSSSSTAIATAPDTVPSTFETQEEASPQPPTQRQQQHHHHQDFIDQLLQNGVALIDIRDFNRTDTHKNNDGDRSRDDYDDDDDKNIPRKVFATAQSTMDQLNTQQQNSEPETTTTWLECPTILEHKDNNFTSSRRINHHSKNEDTGTTTKMDSSTTTASAHHIFGYHPSGGMISTRYNQHREGFIFSDHHSTFDVTITQNNVPQQEPEQPSEQQQQQAPPLPSSPTITTTSFGIDCANMFALLHHIANIAIQNISQHLQLPLNYFQQHYGPTIHHSQWHIKRYSTRTEENDRDRPHDTNHNGNNSAPKVVLPTHTDPSLLSIVILDRSQIQSGALGLQYFKTNNNKNIQQSVDQWIEISHSGHDIAIVFIGSILQYITSGYFMAVKHRVIQYQYHPVTITLNENVSHDRVEASKQSLPTQSPQPHRMAATLFCRPKPSALLHIVPSPIVVLLARRPLKVISFEDWIAKKSKNYQKAK